MQALVRSAVLAGLICACGGTHSATPDAPGGDGSTGIGGLYVHWWSDPVLLPGDIGNNTNISSALFRMTSLRVIGDADPGDARTTESDFYIQWSDGKKPFIISFHDAPSGLYSKVSAEIDGQVTSYSYEIYGTVTVNATNRTFRVRDLNSLPISLDTSQMLEPNGAVDVTIHIDFANALGSIDWSALPTDDGYLDLDTFDSQMAAFRQKLTESFSIHDGIN